MTKSFSSKQASKQASKISLTLPLALTSILAATPFQAFAAWSFPETYVEYTLQSFGYVDITRTPHSTPITRDRVTFSSDPIPYVSATATVYNPYGFGTQQSGGNMTYSFDISDAPISSYVPVSFQGLFSMSGNNLNKGFIPADAYQADVGFNIRSASWAGSPTQSVSFENSCRFFTCDNGLQLHQDTLSSIAVNITDEHTNGISGFFSGIINLKTNELGDARGLITLKAYSKVNDGNTALPSIVQASIDPYLQIDPTWLTANPGATLTLPQGVGNQISAVPVPTAAWLFGSGLLGFLGLKRQRQA